MVVVVVVSHNLCSLASRHWWLDSCISLGYRKVLVNRKLSFSLDSTIRVWFKSLSLKFGASDLVLILSEQSSECFFVAHLGELSDLEVKNKSPWRCGSGVPRSCFSWVTLDPSSNDQIIECLVAASLRPSIAWLCLLYERPSHLSKRVLLTINVPFNRWGP